MSNKKKLLEIQLLEQTLKVKSPEEKIADLQKAAHYLDSKMREVRDNGTAMGNERIALLAALNISYELLISRKEKEDYLDSITSRINELKNKIETTLAPNSEDIFSQ